MEGKSWIFADRETGVNYLYHSSGYGGGRTVLLNADGTPVVTPKADLKALTREK